MKKNFHCCATCQHFQIEKKPQGTHYFCSRLGFATNPKYQFDCWNPKDHVRQLIETSQKND